jgi:hypothetical protein
VNRFAQGQDSRSTCARYTGRIGDDGGFNWRRWHRVPSLHSGCRDTGQSHGFGAWRFIVC